MLEPGHDVHMQFLYCGARDERLGTRPEQVGVHQNPESETDFLSTVKDFQSPARTVALALTVQI